MTKFRSATLAVLLYAALSWLLLWRGASLTGHIFGYGADPGLIIWFLAWWPWAAAHHALALHTHLLWQPVGLNLGWTTNVPLLALLAAPVTLTAGPLAAFNLLAVAAPVLAGWAAYLLCRGLGALPWAAFYGGLIFGFSSYAAAQSFDHLNLAFTVLIPLVLLVVLRRLRGEAGRGVTALWLGLLLGGEFLISEEILATACLLGAIVFLLAYSMEPPRRAVLRALAVDIALAAPLALLPATPILLAMAKGAHDIAHPAGWAVLFSVDALNFLVPTESSWFGGQAFALISQQFTGALDEQTGYLGLAVLLLLIAVLRDAPLRRALRLPLIMLAIASLAALGPVLHIGGRATGLVLPWALLARLPLLSAALPARCMLYAFLALAIIVSLWLSAQPSRARGLAAFCICLSLLPAPHPAWPSPAAAFFRPGRVQQVLGPDPTLLILPFSIQGPSSFWQAENHFGFMQVGGYLGYPPGWAQRDPAVMQLFSGRPGPRFVQDFALLCQLRHVKFVVAGPGTSPEDLAALASLGWHGQKIDDVSVYSVPETEH